MNETELQNEERAARQGSSPAPEAVGEAVGDELGHRGTSAPSTTVDAEVASARPRFGDTDEEVARLVSILPPTLHKAVDALGDHGGLLEIVMDLGRPPEARTFDGDVVFENLEVSEADLEHAVARIGHFGEDNRAGIARTLHRISAIRNREGKIIGLTLRVGRAIFGTVEIVRDIITEGRSILLLGAPGVGKTTMLRETARLLAEEKRVVIVDTSNEIAGDGDIPHPAIGRARRMQVKTPTAQHEVMIEAVENHNPEVIVIDEIGRELEALAARTIAERGVQLIGTAHGRTLENLLMNPTLSDLVGGIESVTLSDEEARRRGTQKSVLERRSPPTFDVVIEIEDWQHLIIHHDTAQAIDAHLRGRLLRPERRYTDADGKAVTERGDVEPGKPVETLGAIAGAQGRDEGRGRKDRGRSASLREAPPQPSTSAPRPRSLKLLAYGVSQNRLRRSSKALSVPIILTDDLNEADAVITLKSYYRKRPAVISDAEERRTPVYVLRSNTYAQIEHALIDLFGMHTPQNRLAMALDETRDAIREVERGNRRMVELTPQVSEIRKQQHELVRSANLRSLSNGNDPHRRVRVYRT